MRRLLQARQSVHRVCTRLSLASALEPKPRLKFKLGASQKEPSVLDAQARKSVGQCMGCCWGAAPLQKLLIGVLDGSFQADGS